MMNVAVFPETEVVTEKPTIKHYRAEAEALRSRAFRGDPDALALIRRADRFAQVACRLEQAAKAAARKAA